MINKLAQGKGCLEYSRPYKWGLARYLLWLIVGSGTCQPGIQLAS